MQATITADAVENRALVGTLFAPERHEVLPRCHWLESFQRYARKQGIDYTDDLFVYYHKVAGTCVLSLWLEKPGGGRPGVMRELHAMHGHPGRLDWYMEIPGEEPPRKLRTAPRPPSRLFLMEKLVPQMVAVRRLRKEAFARARDVQRAREEEMDERKSYARYLEHKFGYHDRTPELVRSGMLPFANGEIDDDFSRRMIEHLKDPDRVRDVKHR